MAQFFINGIVWKPRINCHVMRQFEDLFGIPFAQAGQVLSNGRLKPLVTLAYLSIEDQAAKLKLGQAAFEASIETADQLQEMSEAVAEALNDFFRNPAAKKQAAKAESDGPGETSTK